MAPIAAHGLAHETKEAGTAKVSQTLGTIMSISAYSEQNLKRLKQA